MIDKQWNSSSELRSRRYDSYQTYLDHQAAKLRTLNLTSYNAKFAPELRSRLVANPAIMEKGRGANVLCLGARNGIECSVFTELGFFALGIDLNPGEANRFVVMGDFHDLQFATGSVDIVFTNALDHSFDLDRIIKEVRRVLKPRGVFLSEIVRGSKDVDGREPGDYESIWWDHSEEVARRIKATGFELQAVSRFEVPWVGDLHTFVKLS